ncbi:ABC transporter permease [Rathayibacter soli]|uniref:ABC transporter permease n=1 Tax=Rathayibacter soli TaxID=3144168 RepID=UPI0027E53B4F|nr:ABC transporter permease subunit [Glaciibacter superstes]
MTEATVVRRVGRRRRDRAHAALLVLPALVLVGVVVVGSLGMLVAQSAGLLPFVGEPRLSADAYLANTAELPLAIGISLLLSAAGTFLAVVVGFTAAVVILQGRWCGRLVEWVSALTIPVPHLVGAATMGLLLSDGGFLARLFHVPGTQWPAFVGGPWWSATILEYGWKESAFVALIVVGTLAGRVNHYDETAALLGAGRVSRLRHVLLPLATPALAVSAVIVFVYTLGSYEVAWLLGRAYPEPLPVMAVRLYNSVTLTSRPEAAAIAVITVILSAITVLTVFGLLKRMRLWR